MTKKINLSSIAPNTFVLAISIVCLLLLVFSVTRVYLNADEDNTAHRIQQLRSHVKEAKAHITKLEVERDSLLSPYALRKTAEKIGMNMATQGQIRRISLKDNTPNRKKKISLEPGTLHAAK